MTVLGIKNLRFFKPVGPMTAICSQGSLAGKPDFLRKQAVGVTSDNKSFPVSFLKLPILSQRAVPVRKQSVFLYVLFP